MKYNILTETAFFRAAQNGSLEDMTACYGEFIEKVVDVCGCKNGKTMAVASLLFAGIELKAMGKGNRMVEKAVTFIGEMQKVVEQMPASEIAESAKTGLNWTGDIVNLVELMYGLQEMQCLNDGKLPIEELGNRIFPLFGLQPRIYSRIYIDIKQRATKNGNRTYFLSRMRNMLEERIDQDIHISLRRK